MNNPITMNKWMMIWETDRYFNLAESNFLKTKKNENRTIYIW